MENTNGGVLLIDKVEGVTSHDVVQKVRRTLKIRKVGHTGTLDPFASGLLVILVGPYTKLSPFITAAFKIYQAVLHLGIETDSYDETGEVIREESTLDINESQVRWVLNEFVGETEQIPPPFSAVKVMGKKAYELARKGRPVKLRPRKITIYDLLLEDFRLPFMRIKLKCSSGTYVRSLAYDIGKRLGCGAHLSELRRIQVGQFCVEDAVSYEKIEEMDQRELQNKIIDPITALEDMAYADISSDLAQKIRRGYCPKLNDVGLSPEILRDPETFIKLVCEGRLVAIASVGHSKQYGMKKVLHLKRVFL